MTLSWPWVACWGFVVLVVFGLTRSEKEWDWFAAVAGVILGLLFVILCAVLRPELTLSLRFL